MAHKSGEDFLSATPEPGDSSPGLQLLLTPEPRHRKFLGTLAYVLRPKRAPARDAQFWHDVFVPTRQPWIPFLESLVYHVVAVVALLLWSQWQPLHITQQDPFKDTRLVVYPVNAKTDLPKLDTGSAGPHRPQIGDPTFARQAILSVPREPDNRAQTIVTPPDIVLKHDVRLPNIVAWTASSLPLAPAPAVPVLAAQRRMIAPEVSAVAPAPQLDAVHRGGPVLPQTTVVAPAPDVPIARRNEPSLATAVVPPPPQVTTASRLGVMNIAHAEAVAPAPQIPLGEQRSPGQAARSALAAGAVPPPPSIAQNGTAGSGRVIALSVNPAAPAPSISAPAGNRRGEFSANPQGNTLGSGRPTITESGKENSASTGGTSAVPGLPSGIRIGDASAPSATTAAPGLESMASITIDRHPIASLPPPRLDTAGRKPATLSERTPTETERKVFGPRRFYQMTLNMPNLNSAGGSWIVRFAEIEDGPSKGELFSPLLTLKSDPAYPSELQRANIQGTVTLYAIIHSDGSVQAVRVLEGADDRLDRFAREALVKCHFEPAIKNGIPVALEAVVAIPFRARKSF